MQPSELKVREPPLPARRSRQELAFLPAAVEIIETPPSPTGRAIALTIAAVFCAALIWAWFSPIDIISTARGSLQPAGQVKLVQPVETGVIHAIDVKDGDSVKAGQVLVELDPTLDNADADHIRGDLLAAQLSVARLRAALVQTGDPLASFTPPDGAPDDLVAVERQHLQDQVTEQDEKLATLDRQAAQKQAERDTAQATIDRLEADGPVLKQMLDLYQALFKSGNGDQIQYLQALETYTDQQHQLAEQHDALKAADAAVAAIGETRKATIAGYRSDLSDQLATAEAKAAGLSQDLVKAEQRTRLQLLRAPVDGVVQQLAVHTIGGVVTPAQPLLVLVPENSALQAQVTVPNGDIGFVAAGQPAAIKVDAFPFTRYGLLHGTVTSLSGDAIALPAAARPADDPSAGAPASPAAANGQQYVYDAYVSLDRTIMDIDGREVPLRAGMTVSVEIKTGSRRVLSYLLSPFARYAQDSLHER